MLQELALDTGAKVRLSIFYVEPRSKDRAVRTRTISRVGLWAGLQSNSPNQAIDRLTPHHPHVHPLQMVDAPQGKLPARAEAVTDSVSDAEALKALEQLLPPSGT